MIAGLLWKDRNAQWTSRRDSIREDRFRDLNLDPIVKAMGSGSPYRSDICRQVLESPLQTREEILYRQEIMKDCIRDPRTMETVYEICEEAEEKRKNTWCRLTSPHLTTVYGSAKDLEPREDRAINEVANVMAHAAESLQSLVDQIRAELSFYMGGIHLWEKFQEYLLCFPKLIHGNVRVHTGLYDGTLVLGGNAPVVPNTVSSEDRRLWLITGANQGGKATFLRSIGLCQLMAQCGLFVFAEKCRIPVKKQIFTHFGREEDRSMNSGKLDEKLVRMSEIVDRIQPGAMLLSNEPFSSTNDRDGSEIFLGIVRGLLNFDTEIFTVTHLMDFARGHCPAAGCPVSPSGATADRKENL